MERDVRRVGRRLLLFMAIGLMILAIWHSWPQPKEVIYSLYREQGRVRTIATLNGYEQVSSSQFDLYFTDVDRAIAPMVLETAEDVYAPVIHYMGHRPSGRIPLILYPSRTEMRTAFGWGSGESAMGVYWTGTIRLLSPNVWLQGRSEAEKRKAFLMLNPIAHELTHYVLDYRTHGNYPRWFTEGLAQWVEYNVTGYLWLESESTLKQPLYPLGDLERRFDQLENQPLAYRQSYLLVDYMVLQYGESALYDVVEQLASGTPFYQVARQVLGMEMAAFYDDWLQWVRENQDELEVKW